MKIALYVDEGVHASTINHWLLMAKEGLIDEFEVVKAKDIIRERLLFFDWLIFPGGSGSIICSKLSEDNKKELNEAIKNGLNIMGICAGAYALSNGYDWSLGLIDYEVVDKKFWRRGETEVDIKFSKSAVDILKLKKSKYRIQYHNGPVLLKMGIIGYPHQVLAKFQEDIVAEGGQEGLMLKSPAIIQTRFGAGGNIIAISPHFEKTPKANKIIKKLLKTYLNN